MTDRTSGGPTTPADPTAQPEHRALDLRLGIDVGGTNTDAVVLDRYDRVLAKAKLPTTPDVTGGIEDAVDAVLAAGQRGPCADHPRDARHHPRDQRGAGAPQAASRGRDPADRRARHPGVRPMFDLAARPRSTS